jgi:hypothetical protein
MHPSHLPSPGPPPHSSTARPHPTETTPESGSTTRSQTRPTCCTVGVGGRILQTPKIADGSGASGTHPALTVEGAHERKGARRSTVRHSCRRRRTTGLGASRRMEIGLRGPNSAVEAQSQAAPAPTAPVTHRDVDYTPSPVLPTTRFERASTLNERCAWPPHRYPPMSTGVVGLVPPRPAPAFGKSGGRVGGSFAMAVRRATPGVRDQSPRRSSSS